MRTADQIKATIEIKEEMEKPVPMDRILCGDVGYGKTEVAFRAILRRFQIQNKLHTYVQQQFCLISNMNLLLLDLMIGLLE